jgi:hypothetical protein
MLIKTVYKSLFIACAYISLLRVKMVYKSLFIACAYISLLRVSEMRLLEMLAAYQAHGTTGTSHKLNGYTRGLGFASLL